MQPMLLKPGEASAEKQSALDGGVNQDSHPRDAAPKSAAQESPMPSDEGKRPEAARSGYPKPEVKQDGSPLRMK